MKIKRLNPIARALAYARRRKQIVNQRKGKVAMKEQRVIKSRDKKRNRDWHKERKQNRRNKLLFQSLTFKIGKVTK